MIRLADKKLRQAYQTIESALITLKEADFNTAAVITAIDYLIKRAVLEERKRGRDATQEGEVQAGGKKKHKRVKARRIPTTTGGSNSTE